MAATDVELVRRYRDGDEAAFAVLMERHAGLLHSMTREYFILGATRDDTLQEARVGFYKAVRDFDGEHHLGGEDGLSQEAPGAGGLRADRQR
jgi:DNA-directed RNA polymerase specialized sigma subunit